jgi:hypothetical protein
MTIAWRDNGARCGRFIFMVSAGTVQTAFSTSVSRPSAIEIQPGGFSHSVGHERGLFTAHHQFDNARAQTHTTPCNSMQVNR